MFDLPLEEATLSHRRARQADDDEVRSGQRLFDHQSEILSRQQVLFVQPGLVALLGQPAINLTGFLLVFARVADEDLNLIHLALSLRSRLMVCKMTTVYFLLRKIYAYK